MSTSSRPFISVVIPMYNEQAHIEACLSSLIAQSYPAERFELLCVDGGSSDGSSQIVERFAQKYPNIRLLSNPGGLIARSLNIGLNAASGSIIARMDAHAKAEPDYLEVCAEYLSSGKADNVGGYLKVMGKGFWGEVIAIATTCPFGVGNAQFRCSSAEEPDEPGFPGAFLRNTLEAVNGWDESFVINEDDELNFRLKQAGYKLYKTSRIATTYYCRNSLIALWRQYYRYGYWKAKVMLKHGRPESPRHIIPVAFVAFLVAGGIASALSNWLLLCYLAILCSYLMLSIRYSLSCFSNRHWLHIVMLPIAFLVLHLSYGLGTLLGFVRFLSLSQ